MRCFKWCHFDHAITVTFREIKTLKIALKDGEILIKEADNIQFQIIKSWGKMKWSRQTQTLSGTAEIDLLNKLAGLVRLPAAIEAERVRLNEIMVAVDRERMNEEPMPLIKPPIKVKPFKHQIKGYNMALMVLGMVNPSVENKKEEKKHDRL